MLWVILKLVGRLVSIKRQDIKWFILLAFFEPFLYFIGESFGLKVVSSTVGAVIIATIPLFAPITDRLFLKSPISPLNLFGIMISFSGVLLLIFENDFSLTAPLHGILLLFVAVFSTMGYAVVLKKIPPRYNPVSIITYQNIVGTILFLPVFFLFEWNHFRATEIKYEAVWALLQLSVFASSLAFIFFTSAIRKIGISKANVFVNMIPVFTAFFAWWLLGEQINLQKLVGIIIVISGVFVSQLKIKKYVNRLGKI